MKTSMKKTTVKISPEMLKLIQESDGRYSGRKVYITEQQEIDIKAAWGIISRSVLTKKINVSRHAFDRITEDMGLDPEDYKRNPEDLKKERHII